MSEDDQQERKCLLCGQKLSSLNQGDVCLHHDVMPGSPQDNMLKKKRLQLMQERNKKEAM